MRLRSVALQSASRAIESAAHSVIFVSGRAQAAPLYHPASPPCNPHVTFLSLSYCVCVCARVRACEHPLSLPYQPPVTSASSSQRGFGVSKLCKNMMMLYSSVYTRLWQSVHTLECSIIIIMHCNNIFFCFAPWARGVWAPVSMTPCVYAKKKNRLGTRGGAWRGGTRQADSKLRMRT